MEHLPPDEQQTPSYSCERGDTHRPSLLRQTLRSLLAPILLGAVAAATLPLPAEGENSPPQAEKKTEDPLLTRLRQEIPSLVADLDSSHFRIREQAQRRLTHVTTEWVKTKQQLFPLLSLLWPTTEHSPEQRRRLEKVLAAHEHEELQLLWRPTRFQEPPEWRGKKDPPRVSEILAALEKQTGQRIFFERPKNFADGVVTGALGGQTFWEVLERVRQSAGGKFGMYRSQDGAFVMYMEERGNNYAAHGCVLGCARTRHEDYPRAPQREIDVDFLTDSIALGDASITRATGITDKGREVTFKDTSNFDPQLDTRLVMPFEEGEQSIDLTVTVVLRGYETRAETLKDLTKFAKFKVRSYHLQIRSIFAVDRRQWYVDAQLLGQGSDGQLLMNAIQCRAFDAQGEAIAAAGFSGNGQGLSWYFHGGPHSIQLVLPGRETISEKTLLFKGIPLNR